MNNENNFMKKLATFIVDRRSIIFFFIIAMCLFCAFSRNWVDVCNDIYQYLPENTETRQGLVVMDENFVTFGMADVMVENISYSRAEELRDRIADIEGVKSITFDDSADHYRDACALYSITFDGLPEDEISISSMAEVQELLQGFDYHVKGEIGNPLKEVIDKEMLVVDILAVVVVVTVLIITSKTYAEIPVLLLTFGCAAVLNMGTNFFLGTISFVTDSIAIVLQLALAIDYAIILLHRYQEEHEKLAPREAAIEALRKAIPEISASSLTTVAGLAAMCLMEFRLGLDMGLVLIKAILLSLFSVFVLMPGLLVLFSGWIDRTPHKSFVPSIDFLGRADYATRYVMPAIFVIFLIGGCIFSHKASYAYNEDSVDSFRHNSSQIAAERIADVFGEKNQLVVIVPAGDYQKEREMIRDLESLNHTLSVTGLASVKATDDWYVTSSLNAREFSELSGLDYEVAAALYAAYAVNAEDYGMAVTNLRGYTIPLINIFEYLSEKEKEVDIQLDEDLKEQLDDLSSQLKDARLQLCNDVYSRVVVESDLPIESEESFRYLDILHGIVARYYDESYITGNTQSCYDLKSSFEKDTILIGILSVLFVILVLIFTFNSVGLPILLIAIIQGSIWINFSTPYFEHKYLFFMTYLIISSIQMGANIDYAIVISSRYLEFKEQMPLKDAMIRTLNIAFPTIITSGTMLASAGIIIWFLCSEKTIATIGLFLGQGTLISIFLVMCVLPQILLLGDIIIRKTAFTIGSPERVTRHVGPMYVNGKISGTFSGTIDAEVHGVLRGELSAMVENLSIPEESSVSDREEEVWNEE